MNVAELSKLLSTSVPLNGPATQALDLECSTPSKALKRRRERGAVREQQHLSHFPCLENVFSELPDEAGADCFPTIAWNANDDNNNKETFPHVTSTFPSISWDSRDDGIPKEIFVPLYQDEGELTDDICDSELGDAFDVSLQPQRKKRCTSLQRSKSLKKDLCTLASPASCAVVTEKQLPQSSLQMLLSSSSSSGEAPAARQGLTKSTWCAMSKLEGDIESSLSNFTKLRRSLFDTTPFDAKSKRALASTDMFSDRTFDLSAFQRCA